MITQEIRELIIKELPQIVETDIEIRKIILDIGKKQFPDKKETESRFDRLLEELKSDREKQDRKWEEYRLEMKELKEEQDRKWAEYRLETNRFKEEQEKKWEEYRLWSQEFKEEQEKKWAEYRLEMNKFKEEQEKKWEEYRLWSQEFKEEQKEKWEEHRLETKELFQEIKQMNNKHESTIGALGARWGLNTEKSFRNALKGMLEDSFDVKVLNVNEFDDDGVVFGRPDQIELDVVIKNDTLIICEIKSSISKGEVYLFERKVRFYEKRHSKRCSRMMIISPMIEKKAIKTAKEIGIETYSYTEDVDEM